MDICTYKSPLGGEVTVAVKRLRPSILKNRNELAAFVEEAKLLRKLSHRWFIPGAARAPLFQPCP